MPRPPKYTFYLDENFPVPAGNFLKRKGHAVIEGVKVLKKAGLSDHKHLNMAKKMEAILIGFDRDFIIDRDHKEKIKKSPGVILIQATDTKIKTADRILLKVIKAISKRSTKGKICRASVNKITFK